MSLPFHENNLQQSSPYPLRVVKRSSLPAVGLRFQRTRSNSQKFLNFWVLIPNPTMSATSPTNIFCFVWAKLTPRMKFPGKVDTLSTSETANNCDFSFSNLKTHLTLIQKHGWPPCGIKHRTKYSYIKCIDKCRAIAALVKPLLIETAFKRDEGRSEIICFRGCLN